MLTPGQIAKLQAEDQGRGLLTKLFTDDKPRGQLEAEARPLVDQQAQGFGARAQPQAQIDPSRIVMVNGVPHKRVP
jgi:hypothetical protein